MDESEEYPLIATIPSLRSNPLLLLKDEPVLVATYNDLVLCCSSKYHQRDYFICNPYTIEWVPLPPPPRDYKYVTAVGFICDVPYYYYMEDNMHPREQSSSASSNAITKFKINAEYKYKVVRIPVVKQAQHSFEFKVEIFSSETCEWRESILSFTQDIDLSGINLQISFAYNEWLYWDPQLSHDQ